MRKALFLTLLLFPILSRAQYFSRVDTPKYKTVHQDTINLRGVVIDVNNRPIQGLNIISKSQSGIAGYKRYGQTDRDGKFAINGALQIDTLTCYAGSQVSIINNGSRYIEIHLPIDTYNSPTSGFGEVTAKRVTKKKTTSFKVITNADVYDYYGIGGFFVSKAEPKYGIEKYLEQVKSKIIYPANAIKNNIEGDVEIGFELERDGSLLNYHIIKGIGYGCDEEVIRVLKESPRWRPLVIAGRPLMSASSIKLTFTLTDK